MGRSSEDMGQSAPSCPKCDQLMVLRTARKGANAGNQFWGCSKYPRCRGVVPYEPTASGVHRWHEGIGPDRHGLTPVLSQVGEL